MKSQPYLLAYLAASQIKQQSYSLSEIVRPALVQYSAFVDKVNQLFNVLTLLVLVVLLSPAAFNVDLSQALSFTIVLQAAVQLNRLVFQSKFIKSIALKNFTQKVYKTL